MKTLDTVLKRSNNNFDLVRLIAALMVVFGHSFDLFKSYGYYDPVKAVVRESPGILAVYIFFFLSGIFITQSFLNKKNHLSFARMRLFRIWPGLIVCTLITIFIVGALLSALPVKQYLTNIDTWKFLVSDIGLYNVTSHRLPGLFITNHYGSAVNGSLWTLPFEVKCYCLVFLLGIVSLLRNKTVTTFLFIAALVLFVLKPAYFDFFGGKVMFFFFAGIVACLFDKRFPVDYRISITLIISSVAAYYTGFAFEPVFYVTLAYTSLVLGSSALFKKIRLPGDYSYGIYIYGFVIQQVIQRLLPKLNPYSSLLIVVPAVALLAALSWHLVEKPAIGYGRRKSARNY